MRSVRDYRVYKTTEVDEVHGWEGSGASCSVLV